MREQRPRPPHSLNPNLDNWRDRYLVLICLKCLEKDPHNRYPSAEALAVDLERWLRDKPPRQVPVRPAHRFWLWCRRNPLGASLTATAALLVFVVTAAAILMLEAQQARYDIFEERVKTQSLEIANRFSHYETLLEYLRGGAVEVLTRVEPAENEPVYPAEYFAPDHGRRPPDLVKSDIHGCWVSLQYPSVVEAPSATHVQKKTRQRLMLLRPVFQRVMVKSRNSRIELPPPVHDDLISLLTETGVPIAWAYVALKSGIDCTYPGVGAFGDDYDPRDRSWYIKAAQSSNRGVIWVAPYPDALGLGPVITCSAPIYDHDDQLLGVAGFDLLVSFVRREMLKIADLIGVDAFLVNGQGEVLVSNVKGNLPAGAVKEIKSGHSGRIKTEDKLVAYFSVEASDWYYVVVADVDHIQDVLDTMPRQQHDRP